MINPIINEQELRTKPNIFGKALINILRLNQRILHHPIDISIFPKIFPKSKQRDHTRAPMIPLFTLCILRSIHL